MTTSVSHFDIWVLRAILLFPTCCQGLCSQDKNHVAMFVFGDSVLDGGNNNYLKIATTLRANHWPYGETFFKYPSGRFTNGRIIPDFLAEYAKLPLILPYLLPWNHQWTDGVSFASASAGALAETNQGMAVSLPTQLIYFKNMEKQLRQKLAEAEMEALLSRALYLFSIGSNDYRGPLLSSTNPTVLEEYVRMVIGNLTTVIKEIYQIGGRKFGFLNLPPLVLVPFVKSFGMSNSQKSNLTLLVRLHNIALSQVLKELERELKGFKYSYFDFHTSFSDRISNPSKYGFKVGTVACCGSGPYNGLFTCGQKNSELCDNPSEYVFFDGGHSSDKAYSQFAKLMWNGSSNVIQPCNIKTLLQA